MFNIAGGISNALNIGRLCTNARLFNGKYPRLRWLSLGVFAYSGLHVFNSLN